MHSPVIVDAVRTPIGNFLGSLQKFTAPELGAMAVKALLERTGVDAEQVDEIIMGNVLTAGVGQNPARQAGLKGGLPPKVAALTVNKVCGSGLKAVILGAQAIRLGDAEVVIAGGQENMSLSPFLLKGLRTGLRLGNSEAIDSMVADGLWCAMEDFHMGSTAELVAREHKVSREQMDAYAAKSQEKALAAIKDGAFKNEIVPVSIPQRKADPVLFENDEGPRAGTTAEKLAKLRPAFEKEGTVTAGNASTINDGAAALLLMSKEKAESLDLKPLAEIKAYATAGLEPKWVMMTPVPTVKLLWEKTGWSDKDVDLYELNEAFAVQSVAVLKELNLDAAKVNIHGGAVALGHPIGASGARILTTLVHSLKNKKLKRGIAALCLGGGNGVGVAVEML